MPEKKKPTKKVKCRCGINTVVDIKAATAYMALTRFVCECKKIYHIIDYMNGCIIYYIASKEVDEAYLNQSNRGREKNNYPMSEFYIYKDEIPPDTRVSTSLDCEKCENTNTCPHNAKFCLITETQIQRECFNHCPKCDAGENDIEWGDKDWSDFTAWQNATCNKCGCEFSEVYTYTFSEIDAPIAP